MATDDFPTDLPGGPDETLTESELEALHEVELGLEWLQRAQGCLVEFHHATGHGMDHLYRAEALLEESGRDALASALRNELLPRGVVDGDRWSYDVLEDFQEELLTDTVDFERRVRRDLADGTRHVAERRQERAWKDRCDRS